MIILEEGKEEDIESSVRRVSIDREFEKKFSVVIANDPPEEYTFSGLQLPNITGKYTIPLKFVFYEEKIYDIKIKLRYNVKTEDDLQYKSEEVYDLEIPVLAPFQSKIVWDKDLYSGTVAQIKVML